MTDERDVRPGRLLELTVVDLALIERLDLAFGPGLNVITGETGAGKSLLIDALGLALGSRADSSLVRHGAESARITARMERANGKRSVDDLVAVREVNANGRSSARLGDEPVTAARLAEVAGPVVEIHGQHDQQQLLDERRQRDLLDAFGGLDAERSAVQAAVEAWRGNEAALRELALDPREFVRRLELAEHEAEEIAAAQLRVGEAAEIRARLSSAQHVEAIARGAAEIERALLGEDRAEAGGPAVREALGVAHRAAHDVARFDGRFAGLAERLAGLDAEAADIAAEARNLVAQVDHDPAAMALLEERISLIFALERRYGDDEGAILEHGRRMAAEAARLRDLDGERERRGADTAALLDEVGRASASLSAARTDAAERLSVEVARALEALGFGRAQFRVAVIRRAVDGPGSSVQVDGESVQFDATGIDDVIFRFAPNLGEPARPLARIASGGELSRVALAIKEVLAEADATPTLVFDEIDTGIGGRSADPVGRSLWTLARRHQVLCVTHLPQIAAHADVHFRISKHEKNGRTVTEVERLGPRERVAELAKMLGGEGIERGADRGAAAQAGAEQLLAGAAAWRDGGVPVERPAGVA
ncbi:MAG: DNA repair protein RecN [Candidatus Limnocylindrales bacterium]